MKASERTSAQNRYDSNSLRNFAKAILPDGTAFGVTEHPMPRGHVQYFRDDFGTEFIIPAKVEQGNPFSIRLKQGKFPQNQFRQIAFLYAPEWETPEEELSNRKKAVQVNTVCHPPELHLEPDNSKALMDFCWKVKRADSEHINEQPIRMKLQVNTPGKLICIVLMERCMAGMTIKCPHIFVVTVN